ncbi:Arsenical pump-driving ATPase [Zea mays]|uniref:Arsenical pump-driving ATPase n=1 Tax=Zea mays TaxID=4577 RepID=A0A1D6E955_MAIZE|nr:Arsenical pump-driving ATPase [Zea mays]
MAALINPIYRRLAAFACRRISAPAVEKPVLPLVYHRNLQQRHNSSLVDASGGFSEMLASTRRCYVFGGKGGVGKTSMAASLAVKFANHGEPTAIVSTEPSPSLGDLFEQDMGVGGKTVRITGFDSLFAVEAGQFKIKGEPEDLGSFINNLLGKMGLGTHSDIMHVSPYISSLALLLSDHITCACICPFMVAKSMIREMLDGMPPGLEEALVLSKVIKSIDVQEADILRRLVLDAPSTGHTLKLLSASDWIEMFLTLSIKGIKVASSMPSFNMYLEDVQFISARLEELRQQVRRVREILFDPQSTEFIVVTIPTMMAVTESSRFHESLKKDGAHTRRLVINQVLPPSASDCRFCAAKRRLSEGKSCDFRKKHVPSVRYWRTENSAA